MNYSAAIDIITSESAVAIAAPGTFRPAPGIIICMPNRETFLEGKIISIFSTTSIRHMSADKMLGVFMSPVLCIIPHDNCLMRMNGTEREYMRKYADEIGRAHV